MIWKRDVIKVYKSFYTSLNISLVIPEVLCKLPSLHMKIASILGKDSINDMTRSNPYVNVIVVRASPAVDVALIIVTLSRSLSTGYPVFPIE